MTKGELLEFADHVFAHCSECKHVKLGWGPSSCKNESCFLHRIRLMKEVFRDRPMILEQLLNKTRPGPAVTKPETHDRSVK